MADNRLRIGTHFIRQGREYVIEGTLPSGELQIRDLVTNEFSATPVSGILNDLFYGDLEIVGDAQNLPFLKEKLAASHASDLSMLDRDDKGTVRKREAYRREHYVREIIRRGLTTFTPQSLSPIIEIIGQKINDPNPPSWSTVLRWYKDYTGSGNDVRALVPSWNRRGNGKRRYSGTRLKEYGEAVLEKASIVVMIMEHVVRTVFLRRPPAKVASVYKVLEARIYEYNKHRDGVNKLPVPSLNSLYRYIKTLDPYEVDVAREGKRRADIKWRTNKQGPRPTRPLERTQADHTRADMIVIDTKTKLPLGRPWITMIMDVYTKLILGMYIGFTKPSSASVMYCLLNAIRPKTYIRKVYPEIENTWDAYGIPELLTVDNAKEFYSRNFKDACFQLEIEPHYAPRGAPWYKGGMETYFGTINTQLLHELPGTTFSNIFDKGDYDPKKHAIISLEYFVEIVHTYVIDIYHQQVHRGIVDIPARRWKESIKEWPPNIPARKTDLEVLLRHTEERSIDSSGIEFETLYYNSKELGMIRRQLKPGEKAVFKLDIDDISYIYVYDAMNDKYLPVPASDQEYTKGLTLHQHLVIKSYRRKFAELLEDREGLARAKLRLQQIVEQAMGSSKLLAGREKIARYLNLGMPNYAGFIEVQKEGDVNLMPTLEASAGPDREVGAAHLAGISNPQRAQDCDDRRDEFITAKIEEGDANLSRESSNDTKGKKVRKKVNKKDSKKGNRGQGKSGNENTETNPETSSGGANDDDETDEGGWGSDYDLPV